MPETILVLTEDGLLDSDVDQIADYYAAREVSLQVLVPRDTERNVLVEVINDLGLLDLAQMWEDVVGDEPTDDEARAEAGEALESSVALLREAGCVASGQIVDDDPLPALRWAVGQDGAQEVVVVTKPKILDDTFRRDWASQAREALGVPVLHLYTGSAIVG